VTVELTLEQAAERAGVEASYLLRLQELGILPDERETLTDGDVRRALTARSLEATGVPSSRSINTDPCRRATQSLLDKMDP